MSSVIDLVNERSAPSAPRLLRIYDSAQVARSSVKVTCRGDSRWSGQLDQAVTYYAEQVGDDVHIGIDVDGPTEPAPSRSPTVSPWAGTVDELYEEWLAENPEAQARLEQQRRELEQVAAPDGSPDGVPACFSADWLEEQTALSEALTAAGGDLDVSSTDADFDAVDAEILRIERRIVELLRVCE